MTICNFLFKPHITPEGSADAFPVLPPQHHANLLFETTYLYTQGRYCLVDWVQVRKWHHQREDICYLTNTNDTEASIGIYIRGKDARYRHSCVDRRLLCMDGLCHRRSTCPKPSKSGLGECKFSVRSCALTNTHTDAF